MSLCLVLSGNGLRDVSALASLSELRSLALDNNAIPELPALPDSLVDLYVENNAMRDIEALANLHRLWQLRIGGNSISSLAPLADLHSLEHFHLEGNLVSDLSPISFKSLVELHASDNAVTDLSPLLDGDELLMVDVRRNPLGEEAVEMARALRERGTTVLMGESVPYFPAAGGPQQGFVRVINRSDAAGDVWVEAVDDAGVRFGPVRLALAAGAAAHFNSADLEQGRGALAAGVGRPTAGDWRLSLTSPLDLEVLSYIRTEDGFVTAMHDVATDAVLPFFNPGSNRNQRSILRLVNVEEERAMVATGGYDDTGAWRAIPRRVEVGPAEALNVTAQELEEELGLGDGRGKWRLRVRHWPWLAMSLVASPTGHLTNLSTAPDNAEALPDGRTRHRLPLFLAAGGSRQGFARVINRSHAGGEAVIEALDDAGRSYGPVTLEIGARRTLHFTSDDLEGGNPRTGLAGALGAGAGDWRLAVTSELDLRVLAYVRTTDGFLTSMHDVAPVAENGEHRVVFFNPGSNRRQVSRLRLMNNGDAAAAVVITGIDDRGANSEAVRLTVPAGAAATFTSAELEAGGDGLAGRLGDGDGKWRLRVGADGPIAAMSLLESPTGHLTNVSTGTAE